MSGEASAVHGPALRATSAVSTSAGIAPATSERARVAASSVLAARLRGSTRARIARHLPTAPCPWHETLPLPGRDVLLGHQPEREVNGPSSPTFSLALHHVAVEAPAERAAPRGRSSIA